MADAYVGNSLVITGNHRYKDIDYGDYCDYGFTGFGTPSGFCILNKVTFTQIGDQITVHIWENIPSDEYSEGPPQVGVTYLPRDCYHNFMPPSDFTEISISSVENPDADFEIIQAQLPKFYDSLDMTQLITDIRKTIHSQIASVKIKKTKKKNSTIDTRVHDAISSIIPRIKKSISSFFDEKKIQLGVSKKNLKLYTSITQVLTSAILQTEIHSKMPMIDTKSNAHMGSKKRA
jgi:hypothetical protein